MNTTLLKKKKKKKTSEKKKFFVSKQKFELASANEDRHEQAQPCKMQTEFATAQRNAEDKSNSRPASAAT
jgi:hypothetical protein